MKRFVIAAALSAFALLAGLPTSAAADPLQREGDAVRARQGRTAVRPRAARVARQRWRRMDRDHDGVISREEWRGRPAVFDRLDRNRDGALTRSELARGARRAARRARR
jgi:hypothetical protein